MPTKRVAATRKVTPIDPITELRLLHLADSAFPIGSLAHSLGLETLVDSGRLTVPTLPDFLAGYLEETGTLEAVFFRAPFSLAQNDDASFSTALWLESNDRLSALKSGRESRTGSAVLGENLLNALLAIEDLPAVRRALESARERRDGRRTLIHHSMAFGLAAGALGLDLDRAVFAYLHQSIMNLVSACQRLTPLGQTAATRIVWNLKPAIVDAAARSAAHTVDDVACFTPILDWGAMEHPALTTRLFTS
jgi:urease accessory protein